MLGNGVQSARPRDGKSARDPIGMTYNQQSKQIPNGIFTLYERAAHQYSMCGLKIVADCSRSDC